MVKTSTRDILYLLLLSAIWGSSFLFLRIASPAFGPVFLIEMRVFSAMVVLLPICLLMGKHLQIIEHWKMILLISLTNMAVPFCMFAFAALSVNAGLLSILNATVPFFTALISFLFFQQRLSLRGVLGLVVGFVGVSVLVFDPNVPLQSGSLLAIFSALTACVLYGFALSMVAHKLQNVSGLAITTGSLMFSSVALAPFAYFAQPEVIPQGTIWLSVIALGVVCTGFGYLLFYRLIARIGPQKAITTTFLIPVFSILWGNLFLAENITLFMVFGGILVLIGVGMTTGSLSELAILMRGFGRKPSSVAITQEPE